MLESLFGPSVQVKGHNVESAVAPWPDQWNTQTHTEINVHMIKYPIKFIIQLHCKRIQQEEDLCGKFVVGLNKTKVSIGGNDGHAEGEANKCLCWTNRYGQ